MTDKWTAYRFPERHQYSGSAQLSWQNNRPVVPIIPSHGERQGRIDEALCEFDVTARNRQKCDHFTERNLSR